MKPRGNPPTDVRTVGSLTIEHSWTPAGRRLEADDAQRRLELAHVGRANRFHPGSVLHRAALARGRSPHVPLTPPKKSGKSRGIE